MHSTDVPDEFETTKLKSITEMSDLTEFMESALLQNRDFVAERAQEVVITNISKTVTSPIVTPEQVFGFYFRFIPANVI